MCVSWDVDCRLDTVKSKLDSSLMFLETSEFRDLMLWFLMEGKQQ